MTSSTTQPTSLFRVGVQGHEDGVHVIRATTAEDAVSQWKAGPGKGVKGEPKAQLDSDFDTKPKV